MVSRNARLCVVAVVCGLCGCVTTDPAIKSAAPRKVEASALNGTWECASGYSSNSRHGLLPASIGPANLADVFADFVQASEVKSCDTAAIEFESTPKLRVTFTRGLVESEAQEIDVKSGLRVRKDGIVELVSKSCSGGLALGCASDLYRLYVDDAGSLVVIEKSKGAGLVLLILPMAGSDARMATFERKTEP